jgi:hypothetical protein
MSNVLLNQQKKIDKKISGQIFEMKNDKMLLRNEWFEESTAYREVHEKHAMWNKVIKSSIGVFLELFNSRRN